MVLKRVIPALAAAALLVASAASAGEEYRPADFLNLDLSKAVLSPKRLGPPSEFAPVAVQAAEPHTATQSELRSDHESEPYWAREEPEVVMKNSAIQDLQATRPQRPAREISRTKPKGVAHIKLAHRHGNPLEAQARDTRIQQWPCRSGGGICNWR
jgi:hypothetical protein